MAGPLSGGDAILDGGGPLTDYSSTTLGYQPATRVVSDVLRHVRRVFGDEAGVQLQDADVIGWINDAQDMIVNVNRGLKARFTTDSIKGVQSYKFQNDDILQVESIHYNGTRLNNVPFVIAEQEYIGNNASNTSDVPSVWWEWSGAFYLWPTPNSSAPIVGYYTVGATPVATVSDFLGVPDKYYQAVLQYVMQQAYELDENFNASQLKQGQFQQTLNEFGEEERTAQTLTYETVTVIESDW